VRAREVVGIPLGRIAKFAPAERWLNAADAVLASGELGQSTLALWPTRWLTLSASMALEVIHRGHGRQVALEIRADGTTNVTKA